MFAPRPTSQSTSKGQRSSLLLVEKKAWLTLRSAARRFYAQRNVSRGLSGTPLTSLADHCAVYLTGATLFLSLLLSRVFYIILDFIHVQEEFTLLQSKVAKQSGATGEANEMRKRIDELEAELDQHRKSGRDFGAPSP